MARSSIAKSTASRNGFKPASSISSSSSSSPSTNSTQQSTGAVVILTKASSNASNSGNQDDQSKKKKRPPTPPRKPKINPQNFPGLQFMGKDGFGVADNLSPSNSMPSTPVDTLDSHGVSSVTSNVSASLEPVPLITESKAIDLSKPIAPQQRRAAATESIVQQMITSISSSAALGESADEDALVRILQESERGSNHSLALSTELDLQLDVREDFFKSEEGSLNEHLSAHGLAEVTCSC